MVYLVAATGARYLFYPGGEVLRSCDQLPLTTKPSEATKHLLMVNSALRLCLDDLAGLSLVYLRAHDQKPFSETATIATCMNRSTTCVALQQMLLATHWLCVSVSQAPWSRSAQGCYETVVHEAEPYEAEVRGRINNRWTRNYSQLERNAKHRRP